MIVEYLDETLEIFRRLLLKVQGEHIKGYKELDESELGEVQTDWVKMTPA